MITLNVEDVETPLYPGQYYIYAYSIISCDSWLDDTQFSSSNLTICSTRKIQP